MQILMGIDYNVKIILSPTGSVKSVQLPSQNTFRKSIAKILCEKSIFGNATKLLEVP
jgi:hypothetical protein